MVFVLLFKMQFCFYCPEKCIFFLFETESESKKCLYWKVPEIVESVYIHAVYQCQTTTQSALIWAVIKNIYFYKLGIKTTDS